MMYGSASWVAVLDLAVKPLPIAGLGARPLPVGDVVESISGLTPGTSYSYVAFATNSVGTTYTSPVSTFTTPAVPTVNDAGPPAGGDQQARQLLNYLLDP